MEKKKIPEFDSKSVSKAWTGLKQRRRELSKRIRTEICSILMSFSDLDGASGEMRKTEIWEERTDGAIG